MDEAGPQDQERLKALVDSILDLEQPALRAFELLARQTKTSTPAFDPLHARRAQLTQMSLAQLAVVHREAQLFSQQRAAAEREASQARKKAKEEAQEAKRFYNQPSAQADFTYWSRMDFWTFDQAIALLLGRNPLVLTPKAVNAEIDSTRELVIGRPRPTKFLQTYLDVRALASQSHVMTQPRISPRDAIKWAVERSGLQPPAALVQAVEAVHQPQRATTEETRAQPLAAEPTQVLKRAALVEAHRRAWPSIESDLGHANENGLSAAAKLPERGMWNEAKALAWARQQGKLVRPPTSAPTPWGPVAGSD